MAKCEIVVLMMILVIAGARESSSSSLSQQIRKVALQNAKNFNQNYIVGGTFQQPHTASYYAADSIIGWNNTKIVDLCDPNFCNSQLTSQAVELDGFQNSKISQIITLPKTLSTTCLLKYQYAARQGHQLETSRLNIYWNNTLLKAITPIDYNIVSEQIELPCQQGPNIVAFEADGDSDTWGILLDNVQLYAGYTSKQGHYLFRHSPSHYHQTHSHT